MIAAFAVGVPARDEARRITEAIDALARAAHRSPAPVHVCIAADSCSDATEALAQRALSHPRADAFRSATVVRVELGTAGAAREAACVNAVRRARMDGHDLGDLWVATTDADSAVPPDWFALHEAWARRGVDGVAGLVELSTDDDFDPDIHQRWRAFVERHGVDHDHPHVHGANLGLRADLWLEAGGFAPMAAGEDHELWGRVRALGAALVGCTDMVVRTSARTQGRAPGGFAALLSDLGRDPGYARSQS